MVVHRLTVDAYAVQNPGVPTPRSIRSVALHLISLCAVLEHGATTAEATARMRRYAGAGGFHWLTPPKSRGELTVLHALAATTPAEHEERVEHWARRAWRAWAPHHAQIEAWYAAPIRGS